MRPHADNGGEAAADTPVVRPRRKYRPSIRTILLLVNLAVLVLPLGGLVFFRIYENQLVRETEAELIAQSAVLAAFYRQAVRRELPDIAAFGTSLDNPPRPPDGERYTPLPPRIDLAVEEILPRRPNGKLADAPPSSVVEKLGRDITEAFVDAQRTTLAGLRLLDHRGVVIGGGGEFGLSFAHVQEVRRAMSGHYTAVLRQRTLDAPAPPLASISRGTGVRIFVAYPVVEGDRLLGIVYMSRTPNNILRHMYASRHRFMLMGLGIITLTLLLAWITSRTIGQPVDALAAQARQLANGSPEAPQPLAHYGTREVAVLGQSFLDMAETLEVRAGYLRDFAAHVSHEFKTPLASIRGAAELLGEHIDTMAPAERRRFLENIVDDTDRLRSLMSRLLELARADTLEPGREETPLLEALRRAAAPFVTGEISVELVGDEASRARISADSLGLVARNLVQNAIESGATDVLISVGRDGDDHLIRFADNGTGISAGNRARIFEPFFTTRRASGGTGLGLRIVASILNQHGGRITLEDAADKGTVFVVRLPAV